MDTCAASFLLATLVGTAIAQEAPEAKATPPAAALPRVTIAGTRATMPLPGNYVLHQPFVEKLPENARRRQDKSLYAVVWDEWQARLSAADVAGTARTYTQGMRDRWSGNGVQFLGEEPFRCANAEGTLIDLRRAGALTSKGQPKRLDHVLQVAVGDDERILVVEIVFPEERTPELRPILVTALTELQWDRKSVQEPSLQDTNGVPVPEGLRWIGSGTQFSSTGEPADLCPSGNNIWFHAWTAGEFSLPHAQEIVHRQWERESCEEVLLEPAKEIEAGGRKGFELLSRAKHKLKPFRRYTAVLQDPKKVRSIYFEGVMPEADADEWLPRFRAAVKAWKPTDGTTWHRPSNL